MFLLFLTASAALQTTPAPAPASPLDLGIPELAGTSADPTCGGKPALAQQAFCVATTQAAMQGVADQYDAAFRQQGWLAAAGGENLTVYVKRKETGGCNAFQVLAFADETRASAPAAPGYFAFATIPADVCLTTAAPTPAQ